MVSKEVQTSGHKEKSEVLCLRMYILTKWLTKEWEEKPPPPSPCALAKELWQCPVLTIVCAFPQVGKLIGQKWREMSEEEKQPFCDEYEAEKAVYNEQVKIYRNSPSYKRWMEAKMQGKV